jgi:ankyrin repeat protein
MRRFFNSYRLRGAEKKAKAASEGESALAASGNAPKPAPGELAEAVSVISPYFWNNYLDERLYHDIRESHALIESYYIHTVEGMLDRGAHIGDKNVMGNTPLILAAQFGFEDLAELLIDRGADVNETGDNGFTPLIWAVAACSPGIVRRLIEEGADLRLRTPDGMGRVCCDMWDNARPHEIEAAKEVKALLSDPGQIRAEAQERKAAAAAAERAAQQAEKDKRDNDLHDTARRHQRALRDRAPKIRIGS